MARTLGCLTLILIGLSASACSSDPPAQNGNPPVDGGDAGFVLCANDGRVSAYQANLTKAGARSKIIISSADPAPPSVGNNAWTVKVVDMNDAPISNANLVAPKPFMPDHGHGSSISVQITPDGAGQFKVGNLHFFMKGVWHVIFGIEVPGVPTDTVEFYFCVEN